MAAAAVSAAPVVPVEQEAQLPVPAQPLVPQPLPREAERQVLALPVLVPVVPRPREPEVPAVASLLVQGLVASEGLRSHWPFSPATARISRSPVKRTSLRVVSSR